MTETDELLSGLAKMSGGTVKEGKIEVANLQVNETGVIDAPTTQQESVAKTESTNTDPIKAEPIGEGKTEPVKTEPVKTEPVTKSFEELFKEKTGIDWQDQLTEKIKAEPQKPYEFKSEYAKKLDEYVANGGTEDQFIETQTLNFTAEGEGGLTPAEQIFYQKKLANPDWTDEMIEREMRVEYGFDKWKDDPEEYPEGIEPEDIIFKKEKFLVDAQRAKSRNIEYQKQWSVPKKDNTGKKEELEQQAFAQAWTKSVSDNLKGYSKETFAIGDDIKVESEVKNSDKIAMDMQNLVLDPQKYVLERYLDSKGNTDYNRFRKDMFILNNFETILKEAVVNARAEGGANTIKKDIKNAQPFNVSGSSGGNDGIKSAGQQIAEKMREQGLLNI